MEINMEIWWALQKLPAGRPQEPESHFVTPVFGLWRNPSCWLKFGLNFHTFVQKYEVLFRYISINHELLADIREPKAWCYSEQVLFHQKRKIWAHVGEGNHHVPVQPKESYGCHGDSRRKQWWRWRYFVLRLFSSLSWRKNCCKPGRRASGGVEELIESHASGAVLNVDIAHGHKRGPISPAASSVHIIKHLIVDYFQSHRL